MPILVLVWVGVYFALMLALLLGMWRLPHSRALRDDECPTLSVLVTARNEAADLPACLASLEALDYPVGRLQLVLVDDRSTDETPRLLHAFADAHPHATVVHTADLPANALEAKARGLAAGFRVATGAWVLITDADATVPRGWARHMLSLAGPGVGMVGGGLVVEPRGLVGVLERISWAFTQLFSVGAAGLGAPIICIGPNMGIRRDVYVSAGGLERAEFRIAEDLALFRMTLAAGLRARTAVDAETTVRLTPVPNLRALISQQRRWLGGGVEQGWAYRAGLSLAFGWGCGVAAFLLLGWMRWPAAWSAVWAARVAVDALALDAQRRRMQLAAWLRYLPALELYTVFIFLILPFTFLARRGVTWRGEGYVVRY
ncbi:MAG: glycosyltransferase [Gemmatimonadetes bacterium]|nr:glycosyltransferase [Gemmatimonadota bacterium]